MIFKRLLTLPVCLAYAFLSQAQTLPVTYTVQSLAGSAASGDNNAADSAVLRFPQALAFDASSNLYIADQGNASIRKVTPSGMISTLAGTGQSGYSGDAGPAVNAQLSATISGLAFDAAGNLYISDSANHAIRRIGKDGNINTFLSSTTITGSPFWPNALAFDASGNLYVADGANAQIYRVAQDGSFVTFAGNGKVADAGDGGLATQASFLAPYGLFVDATGAVYVTDTLASRVRKITADGNINAFAGTGLAGMSGDGAAALLAQFTAPLHLTGDAAGDIYVTDAANRNIRQITPDGNISTFAGGPNPNGTMLGDGGPANIATLQQPTGIALSTSGAIYFSDSDSSVRTVTPTGTIYTLAGFRHYAGDSGQAITSLMAVPSSIATDAQGNVFIADSNNFRVRKIWRNPPPSTPDSGPAPTDGSDPTANVRPLFVQAAAIDGTSIISTIAGTGQCGLTGDGGVASQAAMLKPHAIATDNAGNVYVGFNGRIRQIAPTGTIQTIAGGGSARFGAIGGIAVDASGSIYFTDNAQNLVYKLASGNLTVLAGTGTAGYSGDGGPAIASQLNAPQSITVDAAGNLYIADTLNNCIRKIKTDGTIATLAGTGVFGEAGDGGLATAAQLASPTGIAIDASGILYIADNASGTVRTVTADGMIHTIAGPASTDRSFTGFSGENGPALKATFNGLTSIALDATGRIYLVDQQNERIRVLTPAN